MGGWDKSEPTPPSSAARRGGTIFRWLPPHRRRSPSYNLLVNFASLLEGYVRWDKKYPEWCPPASLPHRPHQPPRALLIPPAPLPLPSCYHHSSPVHQHQQYCRHQHEHQHQRRQQQQRQQPPYQHRPPLGYRVRIPGLPPSCHWSAPLPSTLCQPPPAANLCHTRPLPTPPYPPPALVSSSFVSCHPSPSSLPPPPGADSAENMNIIRCLRIRRSAFPRTRVSSAGRRGNERTNSRIKSRVSRGHEDPRPRNSGLPNLAGGAHLR